MGGHPAGDYVRGPSAAAAVSGIRDAEHVDGSRPASDARAARRARPPRPPPWRRLRRLERLEPAGQVGRERRRVRAPGPVRRAVGVALARDLLEPVAVEEDVGGLFAVATRDHHRGRAQGVDRAGELGRRSCRARRRPAPRPRPGWGSRPPHAGATSSAAPLARRPSSSTAPLSATITGSSTTGAEPTRSNARVHGFDRLRGPEHPDLHRVDADVGRDCPHLLHDHLRRHRVDRA